MNSKILAQGPIDLSTAIKLNETQSVGEIFDDPTDLINLLVPNLFILAGTIFFFLLILGGFTIISSGSADGVDKGKQQITVAILGFAIMFCAYWIVQVVEYLTGVTILA